MRYEVPSCTICTGELRSGLSFLPCGHVYHTECITKGIEVSQKCPLCRVNTYLTEIKGLYFRIGVIEVDDQERIKFLAGLKGSPEEINKEVMTKNERLVEENLRIKRHANEVQAGAEKAKVYS